MEMHRDDTRSFEMMTTYDAPQRREQLRDGLRTLHKAIPDQMRGFSDLHGAAMATARSRPARRS